MTNLYKLLKSSKTRTGNNAERCSEEEMEKVIKEADDIKFTNPDLEKQKEFLERIKEWKAKVALFFEDKRTEKTPELINSLLKETLEFKFTVQQIADLESMASSYKWANSVNKELSSPYTTIEALQALISEGKSNQYDHSKVQQMTELLHSATQFKVGVQKLLKSEKVIDADLLEEMNKKAQGIPIELKEKGALAKLLGEVRTWREKCNELLKGKCAITNLENIKKEAEQINVTCKEYENLCENMQPVLEWLSDATKFLVKYSSSQLGKSTTPPAAEQVISEMKKKSYPAKHLVELVESANGIAKSTEEFKKLQAMHNLMNEWEGEANGIIMRYLGGDNQTIKNEIQALLCKSLEYPVDKAKGLQLLDICEHEPWMNRANDAINSKVPVHILEAIFREGNAFTVKTNDIAVCLAALETKISGAKHWSTKFKQLKTDLEKHNEKMQLGELESALQEGEKLNVKIREIEWLLESLGEVKGLQKEAQATLQSDACTFSVLESLLSKIESYNIDFPELRLLKALHGACAVWRKIAVQVILSRHALSVSLLESLPTVESPQPLPEEVSIILSKCQDDKYEVLEVKANGSKLNEPQTSRYCVCRSGDEGEKQMIACDGCNEWFHLECINLTKETAGKISHFICSACVRRRQLSFSYKDSLDSIARITEKEYDRLLKEGHRLRIQFTELKLLEEIKRRLDRWKAKAAKQLAQGVQYQAFVDTFESKKHSRGIELEAAENELMKLYLESENLPVELELSHQIMHLLMVKDWVYDAMKYNAKMPKRKYEVMFNQAHKLGIPQSYPELDSLYKAMVTLYNKLQNFPTDEDPNHAPEAKEEIKHNGVGSVSFNSEELAATLQKTLTSGKTQETELYEMYKKLKEVKGVKASLLAQAVTVLSNAERFRNKARELYLTNPKDYKNLEYICLSSLSVGCIPDSVRFCE